MRFDEVQLPKELLEYITSKGISELYPPQERAIKAGLLEGKSLVVSSPTASGKTLIAIMAAFIKARVEHRKVVYLAPLRALASEKYAEFSELGAFGIRTAISTGDYDSSGESLGRADIVVLTNERFDSIMRHRVSWLHDVGLFIADEVHLAGSDSRGPTLEMIMTKILHLGLDVQMLSLSATISNAPLIAEWLRSEAVELDWRPVPLRQSVYDYGRLVFTDGEERQIPRSTYGAPIDVAMDTVKAGGQSLVFANTRRRAVSLAARAAELTPRFLTDPEKKAVAEAARRILSSGEETSLSKLLAEVVAKGSAFHHAGLEVEHRKIVEEYYRARAIKLLAATPTLCLPEGEEVFGNPGPVAIEQLTVGQRVLTHRNSFMNVVTPIKRRYVGDLIKVTPWGQLPMRMTPEHKVLAVTRKRHSIHNRKGNRHWWSYSSPKWKEARKLEREDLVLFPVIKEEKNLAYLELPEIGPLVNQSGKFGKHWSRIRTSHLELTDKTLEIMGLYVAEGYTGANGAIMFALNQKEREATLNVCHWLQSLGLRVRVIDSARHRRVIRTCSKQLARKFDELFGTHAESKRIPHEFLLLPPTKIIPFVRGMFLGDGTPPTAEYRAARYGTTSRTLAKQLFAALVKIGFMPSLRKGDDAGKVTKGRSVTVTHRHDMYTISLSGKQLAAFSKSVLQQELSVFRGNREFNRGRLDADYYYMPVRRLEREEYLGNVFNLEVEGHNSYVGSFVVHNSSGVNLPARRVVIADVTRYDSGSGGNSEIPILEYRQMAGRAGRPQYDDYGETAIIPPPSIPALALLDHYANGPPEPIESKLSEESAMRAHTLATVATGGGLSKPEIDGLFGATLLARQASVEKVRKLVEGALGYLLGERLIEEKGGLFFATDFGRRVSILYIDPATGVIFRDAIRRAEPGNDYTAGLLQVVARCPDFEPKLPLRNKDYDQALAFLEEHSGELLHRPDRRSFADFDGVLQEMRAVMTLSAWIDEWREEQVLSRLGVEPGDLHRAVDNADWLLHSLVEIAKLFKRDEVAKQAEVLRRRVEAGVSGELVELTALQGVGRVRARALYTAGFRTIEDLKETTAEKLALVEKVGTSVARKIKEQVARY